MSLQFKLFMKRTVCSHLPEKNPNRWWLGVVWWRTCLFTSARSKVILGSKECNNCNRFFTKRFLRHEEVLYLPSTATRKSFEQSWESSNRETGLFSNKKGKFSVYPLVRQGPVVRTRVRANPGLNFNLGFFFFSSKALFWIIFYIFLRVSNHQIVGKEN